MLVLNVLVFFCFWLFTMTETSAYLKKCSRSRKVSISVASSLPIRPGCGSQNQNVLRAKLPKNNNNKRRLDAGGRKKFSKRTGLYLNPHLKPETSTMYASIRLAQYPEYTLAEENNELWFIEVANPKNTMPEDKFLFKLVIYKKWATLQSKLSERYISVVENNCSVSLISKDEIERENWKYHLFNVNCSNKTDTRCYCKM